MPHLVGVTHRTTYSFDRPVVASPHLIRLRPAVSPWGTVRHHRLHIGSAEHVLHWQQDPFGNEVGRVSFVGAIRGFDIEVELVAELVEHDPFGFLLDAEASELPFSYGEELSADLGPHLEVGAPDPGVAEFLGTVDRTDRSTIDVVVAVGNAVASAVRHEVRMDPGVLAPEVTLQRGVGSCRDSAWLLVHLCRHVGLAARFVSGYLVDLAPTGDTTDLHAWAEVYLPGAGWIGIDPTSGLLTAEGHIPLARAPHPRSAAPVVGSTEPCEVRLGHVNTVRRLDSGVSTTEAKD